MFAVFVIPMNNEQLRYALLCNALIRKKRGATNEKHPFDFDRPKCGGDGGV